MLALDQAVKIWARTTMRPSGSVGGAPWPGVFEFTLTYNEGIAFGMFQGAGVYLTPIAIAIAIGSGVYSYKHPHENLWTHIAMGLMASGALGNLYDRLTLGKVTDMFWFRLINFPVFNVADSCITIATLMLMVSWLRPAEPPAKHPAIEPPDDSPESA